MLAGGMHPDHEPDPQQPDALEFISTSTWRWPVATRDHRAWRNPANVYAAVGVKTLVFW